MDWFRWHHGTVTDPKWRVVSRKASVTLRDTLAVWAAMLECASQADERGTLEGWDDEDIAAALDMEPEQVRAIYEAMQGKVLDGDTVTAWEKRQPKREDRTASERKKAQRDRQRSKRDEAGQEEVSRMVTHGHAPEEIRGEERREKNTTASREAASYPPEFEEAWGIYPKRDGGNPKAKAFKAWNARCREGHTPDELRAGVVRYARHQKAKGKVGTPYVMQAATFFGPDKHFLEGWKVDAAPDPVDEMWSTAT